MRNLYDFMVTFAWDFMLAPLAIVTAALFGSLAVTISLAWLVNEASALSRSVRKQRSDEPISFGRDVPDAL